MRLRGNSHQDESPSYPFESGYMLHLALLINVVEVRNASSQTWASKDIHACFSLPYDLDQTAARGQATWKGAQPTPAGTWEPLLQCLHLDKYLPNNKIERNYKGLKITVNV